MIRRHDEIEECPDLHEMLLFFNLPFDDCENRCLDWNDLVIKLERSESFRSRILALAVPQGRAEWLHRRVQDLARIAESRAAALKALAEGGGATMTKSNEIEKCLAMSVPALFVFVQRFLQRSPVNIREWTELVNLVEISPELWARVVPLPSRACPAIGALDICFAFEARAHAAAALSELQR